METDLAHAVRNGLPPIIPATQRAVDRSPHAFLTLEPPGWKALLDNHNIKDTNKLHGLQGLTCTDWGEFDSSPLNRTADRDLKGVLHPWLSSGRGAAGGLRMSIDLLSAQRGGSQPATQEAGPNTPAGPHLGGNRRLGREDQDDPRHPLGQGGPHPGGATGRSIRRGYPAERPVGRSAGGTGPSQARRAIITGASGDAVEALTEFHPTGRRSNRTAVPWSFLKSCGGPRPNRGGGDNASWSRKKS